MNTQFASNFASKVIAGIFIFLFLFTSKKLPAQDSLRKSKSEVLHLRTDDGVEFGLWGPDLKKTPKPVLFILASTIDETLGDEYFRQCGNRLAREYGWLCVSIDLPYHGERKRKGEPGEILGWVYAAKNGIDIIEENNERMHRVLQYLITQGYADKEKIVLCGTSRGGYLALQYAAVEPMVKSVAAFAPAIDLSVVREFKEIKEMPLSYSLNTKIEKLSKKWIWIVIGDQDSRVDTDEVVRFSRKVSEASKSAKGVGGIELNVMYEPRGHTTPVGSVDRAVDWILKKTFFNAR